MNFGNREQPDEPEINFIPLIDLLLVILIFLMVTTTYNKINGIKVELPKSDAPAEQVVNDSDIQLIIENNRWQINGEIYGSLKDVQNALGQKNGNEQVWVIIHAQADTPYQKLIDTMRTAQSAGFTQITMRTVTP